MPKVCHLLLGAANQVAGIQKYLAELVEQDTLLVINTASVFEKYLKNKKIKYVKYSNLAHLLKTLRKNNIQILHCHLGQALFRAAIASLFMPNLKIVYTQHFIEPAYTHSKFYQPLKLLFRLAFSRAAKIVAISKAVQTTILERKEAPLQKCVVIHNGITIANVYPRKKAEKKVLTICRMQKEKRPDVIVALAKQMPDFQFTILGDGALLNKLRSTAPKNCNFAGFVTDVQKYIRSHSLFLLAAPAEPFGIVFLEALAGGLPVIAVRNGGALEVLNKNCAMFLNAPEDSQAEKYIRKIASNSRQYAALSQAAVLQAKKFDISIMKRKINNLYQELLS